MAKTLTLLVYSGPYHEDNRAWHALRMASAGVTEGMRVRIHLLETAIFLGVRNQRIPEGEADMQGLLAELIENGIEVSACDLAMEGFGLGEADLLPGVRKSSLSTIGGWLAESDLALSF